jgi:preprotein translocase subunit YajC
MFSALFNTIQRITFLLGDLIIIGGDPAGTPGNAPPVMNQSGLENGLAPVAEAPPGLFGGGWTWILVWGGIILVMYLLMFRPQRKREKKMKEMQAAITVGDNVITNAGLFGRIADVGEDCFIIEFGTNRNIRIPILKSEVAGIRAPKMTPQSVDTPSAKE